MRKREKQIGLLLALPALIGFFIFYAAPLILTIKYSFTWGNTFVGLENYEMVLKNERFLLAAKNTLKFLFTSIPLIIVISLGLALLLRQHFPGNRFYRLAFLFPMMVPVASTVMVVQIFLSPTGILNSLLIKAGIPIVDWLNSGWAFGILVILFLWKNTGYNIILLLAGLAMIPKEYYEISRLDGAKKIQQFRYITLPILSPILFFTLILSILNSFKCFREAFLIGGTHPDDSIYFLQHFMNNNFENLNYPRLAVAAVFTFGIIFIIIGVGFGYYRWKRRENG